MRKLFFEAALIMLSQFSAWAQPVATSANVTDFDGEFYFAEATNFDPGPAGANQTWDFSHLDLIFAGTDTPVALSQTPFAAQFPTANNCYVFSGMFPPDRYYYQKISADKYEIIGLAMTATTGENYTPNPRTFAVFPYTFGTVFSDTYRTVTETTDTSVVITYDAYGTLILPTGTYNNAIRQKIVMNGTTTNYVWFNVQPFYPLLQTVLEENSLGIVKQVNLGVTENPIAKNFKVYPNPASDLINIDARQNLGNAIAIELFDLMGKRLIVQNGSSVENDPIQLSIASLNAGIYVLKITDSVTKSTHTQRVIKK